jgi:hypothetical protein
MKHRISPRPSNPIFYFEVFHHNIGFGFLVKMLVAIIEIPG